VVVNKLQFDIEYPSLRGKGGLSGYDGVEPIDESDEVSVGQWFSQNDLKVCCLDKQKVREDIVGFFSCGLHTPESLNKSLVNCTFLLEKLGLACLSDVELKGLKEQKGVSKEEMVNKANGVLGL